VVCAWPQLDPELQLNENTLVFFVSDNGGPITTGASVNGSSNLPLRASKRQLFEGGIRVPLLRVVAGTPARRA
jgi:arylsulfatase A-like enzyme